MLKFLGLFTLREASRRTTGGQRIRSAAPTLAKPKYLGYNVAVPRVVAVRGYAVKVFTDDHGPPHVHVLKDGILLKISLEPVAFLSAKYGRPSEHVKRDAVAVVRRHLEACWVVWRRIYGENTDG
jgi:hypothetical protein